MGRDPTRLGARLAIGLCAAGRSLRRALMIFHCPRCQAGHSVPVSMIPGEGLPLSCRRCEHGFVVDVPPGMSDPALRLGETPGATRVGVTPFAELELVDAEAGEGRPTPGDGLEGRTTTIVGPAPEVTDLVVAPEPTSVDEPSPGASDQQPTLSFDAVVRPSTEDTEPGVIPGEAPPLDGDSSLYGPLVRRRRPPEADVSGVFAAPDSGVFASLDSGVFASADRGVSASPDGGGSGPRPGGARRWLQTQADRFGRDWPAFKLAVLFGPLVTGVVILVAGLRRPVSRPGVVRMVEDPAPVDVSPALAPPPPARRVERAAASRRAYVQVDRARLRVSARDSAPIVARLPVGRSVRVVEQRPPAWALVLLEPDGPVGFMKQRALGATRPLLALARDRAFTGCQLTRTVTRRDCLAGARSSHATCELECEAQSALSVERCKAACQLALDRCVLGCQSDRRR